MNSRFNKKIVFFLHLLKFLKNIFFQRVFIFFAKENEASFGIILNILFVEMESLNFK